MNPNTVFSASLVTSLVLWFPSMQACLHGDLDLAPAGLRYLAALAVSRLAMNGLARLVNAYRAAQDPAAAAPRMPEGAVDAAEAAALPPPSATPGAHRRRSDRANTDEQPDPASVAA